MVLEERLRLKSGRLGTEAGAGDAATLVSGLVGTGELVPESPSVWFALGAGEFFRETSERFGISAGGVELVDALGVSTDAGFDNCWEFELGPSLARVSVILASSISPSSTSSFPEAVLIIFGTPFALECNVSILRQGVPVDLKLTLSVKLVGSRELLDSACWYHRFPGVA